MLMIIYQSITALSFLSLIVIGIMIEKNTPAKKSFAVFCFVSAMWVLSNFMTTVIERAEVMQLTYSTGIATALAVMHWSSKYTGIVNIGPVTIGKKFMVFSYALVGLFMILSMLPGAIVRYAKFISMGTWEGATGPFFYIWAFATAFYIWLTVVLLFTRYKRTNVKGIKARYFYVFSVLFFVTTTITIGSLILPMFGILQLANLDAPSFSVFVVLLWHFIASEHLVRIKIFFTQIILFMFTSFVMVAIYLSFVNVAGEMVNKYFGVVFSSFILSIVLYLLLNFRPVYKFLFPVTLEKKFLEDFSAYMDKTLGDPCSLEKIMEITLSFFNKCGVSSLQSHLIDRQQDAKMFKGIDKTGYNWNRESGELVFAAVTPSHKIICRADADTDFPEYEFYIPIILKILKNAMDNATLDISVQKDPLSGLYRREYFISITKSFLLSARRRKHPVAILVTDIDDFKKINDTYGHEQGDSVIRYFSQVLRDSFRMGDATGRLGGEEFGACFTHREAVVDYDAFKKGVCNAAERFRKNVMVAKLPCGIVTATCGLVYSPNVYDYDILMKNADSNLYKGKNDGKNIVVSTEFVVC